MEIHYHPEKSNVVADALSRKSYGPKDAHLQEEIARLNVHIVPRGFSHTLNVQPTLEDRIRKAQGSDKDLMKIRKHTGENKATWEREDALKKEFPHLFRNQPNLEDEIHFKWGRFVTSRKFTK